MLILKGGGYYFELFDDACSNDVLRGAVVVFFVRVILFFMSRNAEDAPKPAEPRLTEPRDSGHRTASRHESIAPTQMPSDQDTVTREEIVKLFGGALRVR